MPRKPKIALPLPSAPNIAVSLDVMAQEVRGTKHNILVMLDAGDMMLRLARLSNDSARTAFNAYLSRWMSIFDAPIFTFVDRGTNLTNKYMAENLRYFESQLCPIPTEAPWTIGTNERSHRFLHKAIDRTTSSSSFDPGDQLERLLAEIEMAWNFVQHTNRTLPHFNRFGVMPRVLGEMETTQTVQDRIALMEMARQETARMRAENVISNAFNAARRHVTKIPHFNFGEKVWFHSRNFGWRAGTVARIDRPTIHVSLDSKLYPSHESRVRPFFGEAYVPPEIMANDDDEVETLDRSGLVKPLPASSEPHTAQPIFVVRQPVRRDVSEISTTDGALRLKISPFDTGIMDSDEVYPIDAEMIHCDDENIWLSSSEPVKSLRRLPKEQQESFLKAKRDEIQFLIDKHAVEPVLRAEVQPDCEVQPMKWVLFIKRNPAADPPIRYRARLVSASHLTSLRHSLNGNAPTVALSTIRCLLAIAPTWDHELRKKNDELDIIVRDVTKAYLQSMPTKRLIYYRPPPEFFQMNPQLKDYVWKGLVQVYGDVEAGKYWNKTLVPWLCDNMIDYKQSLYDPSLLQSTTTSAATAL